ncbi:MAG: Membrane lipoprotein TmpC [Dehalococcoidia bacterium]|nr:Membrane lipoprotein TmpC [Chloroflexota bacterium]
MRKGLIVFLAILLVATLTVGCARREPEKLKVGMVTDAGTIDDRSFNQGTWEGVLRAQTELGVETRYLKPVGTTEADYVKEIANLVDAGFRLIVTPGFKFETAIYQAQKRHTNAKFVLIDGRPHKGDRVPVVGTNTVSIFFAEHESGFLAGLAAALQLREGEFGFIGGMAIPPVQKFNWGFQQGVAHANANFGTTVSILPENVVYQGTFHDVAAGQQLAAVMFDRGVRAIFAAAGGVGIGVINEARARALAGKEAWVVGVDVDQFNLGVWEGSKSVILTSAMKRIDQAAFDMIKAEKEGKFPGGQTLVFNAKNDGIGIPATNPNLSAEVQARVKTVFDALKAGTLTVSAERGTLLP